jgi:hypothetical protein
MSAAVVVGATTKKDEAEDDVCWTLFVGVGHFLVFIFTLMSFFLWIGAVQAEMLENDQELIPGYRKEFIEGKQYISQEPALRMWGKPLSKDLLWNSAIYTITFATLVYMVFAIERHFKVQKHIERHVHSNNTLK